MGSGSDSILCVSQHLLKLIGVGVGQKTDFDERWWISLEMTPRLKHLQLVAPCKPSQVFLM